MIEDKKYNLKIFTDNIEPDALNQLYTLMKQDAFKDCKVRIQPDTHAGAGCVIGFTADLKDKVVPNLVGVDIGCFTGDTKVWLAGGYYETLKNLIDKEEKILVESYDLEQEAFVYNEAIPMKTRENAELIEVKYKSKWCVEQTIRCTLDHQFLVADDTTGFLDWIKAEDLKENMRLFSETLSSDPVQVISTRLLEEKEDVYCLNVEETHNFIINGGIVVHNCGMLTIELKDINFNLEWLDEGIRKYVPAGHESHSASSILRTSFDKIKDLLCFRELKDSKKFERQIGTLGGGNHFIELDKDDEGNKYLVIHTGSRNLGKQVAEYYQKLAIELMSGKDELFELKEKLINDYKEQGKRKEIQSALKELEKNFKTHQPSVPNDLCYLTGKYKDAYLHDMKICQEYAVLNREMIGKNIIEKVINPMLKDKLVYSRLDKFQTVHNYLNFEDNIIRKGAVSAKKDERLIIPINMRDGSIIAIGKGNEDWNCSAPHGAGRLMSRSQAKKTVDYDEYVKSMEGIYTTSVNQSTIDESPMVYKDMQEIIDNIQDTVEIERIIKPIYNFKASE